MNKSITEQIRDEMRSQIESGATSQYRLSRDTGIAQATLSGFLNGCDSRGEHLTKLARALKMRRLKV